MASSVVGVARERFHAELVNTGVLSLGANGVPSNADKSQRTSINLAQMIIQQLGLAPLTAPKLSGQRAGKIFEGAVAQLVAEVLPALNDVRPGRWSVENVGSSRGRYHLASYIPYTHLDELAHAIERDPTLTAVLGNSYDISPDVLVVREALDDSVINARQLVVDPDSATRTPLRLANHVRDGRLPHQILHAVISCKWTLRSDRAQNARSEALGVIRNRKGRAPHIAVVTAEPSPSRLASLALGTGDIDTVYHFALPELMHAALHSGNDEALEMLSILVDGDRLRDISDLPLDLAI